MVHSPMPSLSSVNLSFDGFDFQNKRCVMLRMYDTARHRENAIFRNNEFLLGINVGETVGRVNKKKITHEVTNVQ